MTWPAAGPATVTLYLAPTLDTIGHGGVRIGLSVDNEPVRLLEAKLAPTGGAQDTPGKKAWADAVCDNVVRLTTRIDGLRAGRHVIKVWRVDDNIVLQKVAVSAGDPPTSYLGPTPREA
jgi:hypothetical protein